MYQNRNRTDCTRTFRPRTDLSDRNGFLSQNGPGQNGPNFILDRAEESLDSGLFVEASQLVSMSPSAFSRFFKRHTGQTFSRFVNEIKISRSTSLMLETNQTILRVSLESGFGSLSHFNRVFTEIKGIPPGKWRNEIKSLG